jgi:hypothetical protein
LLAQGRWLSPGTLASSTTKTGRHDIAEILLKVALKHQNSKSNQNPSHFERKNKASCQLGNAFLAICYDFAGLNCLASVLKHIS